MACPMELKLITNFLLDKFRGLTRFFGILVLNIRAEHILPPGSHGLEGT
jgi:hypothetical protein